MIALIPIVVFAMPPAPNQSEYLKSVGGGFLLNKNFLDFEYALNLEVIKKLPQKAKMIAYFENPDNPDGVLKSNVFFKEGTTITVLSPPVKHLKIKNYMVEVKIYSDDTMQEVVSTHSQALNSPFDYNSIHGLAKSKMLFPKHTFQFDLDGREWAKGFEHRTEAEFIREYVIKGQKIDDWSELITVWIILKDVNPDAFINHINNEIGKTSIDYKSNISREGANDITLTWSHKGSGQWPAQREIKRAVKFDDGVYLLSYTVKENDYNKQTFEDWEKRISSAILL